MLARLLDKLRRNPERAVFVAAGVVTATAGARRMRWLEFLSKPLLMLSIGFGLWRTRHERSVADNALLGVATGASLAGDWLMFNEEFAETEEEADWWIVRGASAFAVNHVAMITLAVKNGARPRAQDFAIRAGGLLEGVVLLATRRRHLLKPLGRYSALLATASAVAASPELQSVEEGPSSLPGRAEIGGISFIVSDAMILHRQLFLHSERSRAAGEAFVLTTYAAAQRLLFDAAAAKAGERARRR